MNRVISSLICWLLIAGNIPSPLGAQTLDYWDELASASRGVDSMGNLDVWEVLASPVFQDTKIPIWLNFHPGHKSRTELPAGWEIPFIEARATQESETNSEVLLPCGLTLHFQSGSDGTELLPSGGWRATVKGRLLKVTGFNTEITYLDGLIKSAKCKNTGLDLEWIIAGPRREVSAVVSKKDGRCFLKVDRFKSGLEHKMEISFPNGSSKVSVNYFKTDGLDSTTFRQRTGLEADGIRTISFGGGPNSAISFDFNREDQMSTLEWKHNNPMLRKVLRWDTRSGRALNINGGAVSVSNAHNGVNPGVSIRWPDQQIEVIQKEISSKNGIVTIFDEDGTSNENISAIDFRGRSLLRKECVISNGERRLLYRSSFNSDGQIIQDSRGDFVRKLEDGKYKVYEGGKLIRVY